MYFYLFYLFILKYCNLKEFSKSVHYPSFLGRSSLFGGWFSSLLMCLNITDARMDVLFYFSPFNIYLMFQSQVIFWIQHWSYSNFVSLSSDYLMSSDLMQNHFNSSYWRPFFTFKDYINFFIVGLLLPDLELELGSCVISLTDFLFSVHFCAFSKYWWPTKPVTISSVVWGLIYRHTTS